MTTYTNRADYCVVYRTGGTLNFKWHRTLAMTYEEAIAACADTRRGGRRAHVERYSQSVSIGLPETFGEAGA